MNPLSYTVNFQDWGDGKFACSATINDMRIARTLGLREQFICIRDTPGAALVDVSKDLASDIENFRTRFFNATKGKR